MGLVPYVHAGLRPRQDAAATPSTPNPKVEGSILDKHGIFTFGASARESYERMIELVTPRRGAACQEPQGGVRHRATAAAGGVEHRGRADHPRRLQPEERRRAARTAA